MSGEAAHLLGGHGLVLDVGWRHHFLVTLWHGLTWPILLTSVLGVVLMASRRPARAALLLAFPLAYYAFAGRGLTVFARYMVPVVPFLCVTAAYAAVVAGRRAAALMRLPSAAVVTLFLAALGGWSLAKSIEIDRLLARRTAACSRRRGFARTCPGTRRFTKADRTMAVPDLTPRRGDAPFVIASFDERRGTFRAEGADLPAGPDVIVVQESPLVSYSSVSPALRQWLTRYELRSTVPGI